MEGDSKRNVKDGIHSKRFTATWHLMQKINLINYRIRVTLADSRQFTGQMLAFDVHMNLVLADTEEFRKIKRRSKNPTTPNSIEQVEEKRTLGLVILRGEFVISISVDAPPPGDAKERLGVLPTGPGMGRAVGRGSGIASGAPMGTFL